MCKQATFLSVGRHDSRKLHNLIKALIFFNFKARESKVLMPNINRKAPYLF
jgi:hypothetical protein